MILFILNLPIYIYTLINTPPGITAEMLSVGKKLPCLLLSWYGMVYGFPTNIHSHKNHGVCECMSSPDLTGR